MVTDSTVVVLGAMALAGASGGMAGRAFLARTRAQGARRRLLTAAGIGRSERVGVPGSHAHDKTVARVVEASRRISLREGTRGLPFPIPARARAWFDVHARKAGLSRTAASVEGMVDVACRMAVLYAAMGLVAGLALSTPLAVAGFVGGAALGASLPFRAVLRLQRERAAALGRELSEMLEVVALGLRSGLSFDRGFQLYCEHFTSPFARSCESARRMWAYGLASREQALRDLAGTYDSSALERVVESIVRSLRFGSSLAEVLEQSALDARQAHRAAVQEKVAKAPVKMMIPTGTLILPAMLLLVLGPVLLELMRGF